MMREDEYYISPSEAEMWWETGESPERVEVSTAKGNLAYATVAAGAMDDPEFVSALHSLIDLAAQQLLTPDTKKPAAGDAGAG